MQFIYDVIILNNYLIIILTRKDNNVTHKYFMLDKEIINAKISSEKVVLI